MENIVLNMEKDELFLLRLTNSVNVFLLFHVILIYSSTCIYRTLRIMARPSIGAESIALPFVFRFLY